VRLRLGRRAARGDADDRHVAVRPEACRGAGGAARGAGRPAARVAVAGIDGAAGIRPASLETSSDGSLERLSWTAWGDDGAAGAGEFHVLECQPNCATGHTRTVPASVALSDVRVCDGRRYYGRAVVTLASGPAPTSYVRAPC
jgi:hypothetical protein